MKPNFALNLSNDGVELLHRGAGGWVSLGSVQFESDDVQAGCARLLAEAEKLEPGNVRTKLIIPESQLRYHTVLAPGPTDEARRYQIEAEIEALTPYSIDELAYDFVVEDDHALIVICARETLEEAEQFAVDAGFNPVAFVAAPEPGLFHGEPNFGETSVARGYLGKERVEFDAEPVRVVGAAAPAQAPQPAPAAPPTAPADSASRAARASAATGAARGGSGTAAAPRPAMPEPAPAHAPAPRPREAAAPKLPETARPAPASATPASPAAATPAEKSPPPSAPLSASPSVPNAPAEPLAKVGNLVRRMGTRLRRERAREAATAPEPTASAASRAPAATGDAPSLAAPAAAPGQSTPETAGKSDAAPVAFASRRRATPVLAATGPGASARGEGSGGNPGGRIAVLGGGEAPAPSLVERLQQRARAASQAVWGRLPGRAATSEGSGAKIPSPAAPPSAPVAASGASAGPSLALGGARRREAPPVEPIVPASRPPASEREKVSEAEKLTIFGARGKPPAEPGLAGKALMIGGAAALLLVSVAAWYLYFSSTTEGPITLAGDPATGGETAAMGTPEASGPASGDEIEPPATIAALPDAPAAAGQGAEADPAAPAEADTGTDTFSLAGAEPDAADPLAQAVAEAVRDATGAGPTDTNPDAGPDAAGATAAEETTSAEPAVQVAERAVDGSAGDATGAGDATVAESTDPDQLLEALVAEALNETLPSEVQDLAAQTAPGADQPATAAAPDGGAASVISGAATASVNDAPQVAAVSTASRLRLSLPGSLPAPRVDEVPFEAPPPPPPFGAQFDFDENGLVVATPEGALTPSGVTVYARRPAAVPPPRPAGIAPEVPQPAAEALDPEAPRADPALAGFRPRPRSERVRRIGESLAPPAAPETAPTGTGADTADPQQDAALDQPQDTQTAAALETPPPGGVSLAALRPQRRPTDLVPPAPAATPDAGAEPAPDPGAETAAIDGDAAPEAVAVSLRPNARPSDITERARAVLAAAGAGQQAEDQASESAVAAAQPDIPSSASVARQATETNAIRLNQINLIGVFGTAENRRALVRLSSGRRVRVSVGDRLDGGRVTAIGDDELHYTKSGRDHVLRIGG